MAQHTQLPADHGLTCPQCQAPLEHHFGTVEIPVIGLGMRIERRKTQQPFLSCTGCEWCETVENLLRAS